MTLRVTINGKVETMTKDEFDEIQAKADATVEDALGEFLASEEGQLDTAFKQSIADEMLAKRAEFAKNFKPKKVKKG